MMEEKNQFKTLRVNCLNRKATKYHNRYSLPLQCQKSFAVVYACVQIILLPDAYASEYLFKKVHVIIFRHKVSWLTSMAFFKLLCPGTQSCQTLEIQGHNPSPQHTFKKKKREIEIDCRFCFLHPWILAKPFHPFQANPLKPFSLILKLIK